MLLFGFRIYEQKSLRSNLEKILSTTVKNKPTYIFRRKEKLGKL